MSKTVSGQTTTFVYDAFGNLAAEYGGTSNGCGTCYVTTDHLGSTRLLTNSAGSPFARYDYEPFGTEIGAGYDGRTTAMFFTSTPDTANLKFTGQMRDQESALDFFTVRYNSGAQGRFQSTDPGNAGADPSNPQSWNGYAYVNNNPLSYTDPSGMFVEATAGGCAIGGPAGCAIGAAIDIGELLAGLFAGGIFGGPPPSIAPSLATPSSPILQPSPDFDSQGWNGQAAESTDPDGLGDSGTLFGSGNTSPYVFSATPGVQGGPAWWDLPGQWFIGFGDLVFNNKPSGAARMAYAVGGELAINAGTVAVARGVASGYSGLRALWSVQGTIHGAERMADASRLTIAQIRAARLLATAKYTQANGGVAFIREVEGGYNVVIQNPSTGRVITTFKHLSARALARLAENYGWQ